MNRIIGSMKQIFTILFTAVFSLTIALASTSFVSAQVTNDSGLTISPPSFELSGNPGDTLKNSIRLENRNDFNIKIAIDKRNFTAIGEEGAIGLTEETTNYSLASWITIEGGEIIIPAKGSRTFPFAINVPLSAEPGGHFGSIIFRTIPEEIVGGSGATLAQEIGSLILLKIAGNSIEEGSIESFAPTRNFYEYGPVNFETRIKNSGNVHLKPTGTITITNMLGKKVATISIDNKNVLPGAVRKLETSWDTKWRFGMYTATAVIVYGRDLTQRSAVSSFTVVPYRLILLSLIILLIIGRIVYKSRKRLGLAIKIIFTGKT